MKDNTLKKIIDHFEKILKDDPIFTGKVSVSLCLGGLTDIEEKKKIKIK